MNELQNSQMLNGLMVVYYFEHCSFTNLISLFFHPYEMLLIEMKFLSVIMFLLENSNVYQPMELLILSVKSGDVWAQAYQEIFTVHNHHLYLVHQIHLNHHDDKVYFSQLLFVFPVFGLIAIIMPLFTLNMVMLQWESYSQMNLQCIWKHQFASPKCHSCVKPFSLLVLQMQFCQVTIIDCIVDF